MIFLVFIFTHPAELLSIEKRQADICIYGGTANGIMAAVAASQEGCNVILAKPAKGGN